MTRKKVCFVIKNIPFSTFLFSIANYDVDNLLNVRAVNNFVLVNLSACKTLSSKTYSYSLPSGNITTNASPSAEVYRKHLSAKVQLSEQNAKQKGKFFHFCLYFRAWVSTTDRSKLFFFKLTKKIVIFFKISLLCRGICTIIQLILKGLVGKKYNRIYQLSVLSVNLEAMFFASLLIYILYLINN